MTVQDVMDYAKAGELSQVSYNDADVLSYINLGLLELYKRFNLRIGVEALSIRKTMSIYTLRNKDINELISVYNIDGKELRFRNQESQFTDSCYDIEQLSYNTFIVPNPSDEDLFTFVYKASPITVRELDDEVEMPDAMLEALLHYIGYRAHGSVDGNINAENNTHYMRFEKSCEQLKNMGYSFNSVPYDIAVAEKGYV
jgi:hypothetical protein